MSLETQKLVILSSKLDNSLEPADTANEMLKKRGINLPPSPSVEKKRKE